jgi:hypothetical protein
MNTMIPTELRFDLDLQDLPARAVEVSSEALSLSGGYNRCYKNSTCCDVLGRIPMVYNAWDNILAKYCPSTCRTSPFSKWNGQGNAGSNGIAVCGCCK